MAFFANRKLLTVNSIDWVILTYPIFSINSIPKHRDAMIEFIGESYAANYQVGLGYMFCYGDIARGLMFLRNAYVINARADRQLDDWCEVVYPFAIASIASGNISDKDIGINELARIHMAAAYYSFCLEDIRREIIRRLTPSEMVVLRELPRITCPYLVSPCQYIDDVLGCQGINASITEAQQCYMRCVATVEYMKFRSELYIHCL